MYSSKKTANKLHVGSSECGFNSVYVLMCFCRNLPPRSQPKWKQHHKLDALFQSFQQATLMMHWIFFQLMTVKRDLFQARMLIAIQSVVSRLPLLLMKRGKLMIREKELDIDY